MKTLIKFLKDEDGQTSTEYILLLAVVAMIIFRLRSALVEKLTGITDSVFEQADKAIQFDE